jgi:hypothetical protein
MDRRGFVSALLPTFLFSWSMQNGDDKEGVKLAPLGPGKYLLFADPVAVDFDEFTGSGLDGVEIEIVEVHPRGDQTISDCVLLYKVGTECDS